MLRPGGLEDALHEYDGVYGKGWEGDWGVHRRGAGRTREPAKGQVRAEPVAGPRPGGAGEAMGEAALEFKKRRRSVGFGGNQTRESPLGERDEADRDKREWR